MAGAAEDLPQSPASRPGLVGYVLAHMRLSRKPSESEMISIYNRNLTKREMRRF